MARLVFSFTGRKSPNNSTFVMSAEERMDTEEEGAAQDSPKSDESGIDESEHSSCSESEDQDSSGAAPSSMTSSSTPDGFSSQYVGCW